jgi:RNA polymerase II elongation factor ELL
MIEKLRRDDVGISDSERSDRVRDREREWDREMILKGKERERDGRERDRRERESERERERERDRERERRNAERQRERERARKRESEFESDRERERIRKKPCDREWSQEREEGERSDDGFRPPKRKKARDDDDYETTSRTIPKKRRMDSSPPKISKPRDLSLPKKPELDLAPPPKVIKKESPQPPRLPKIKKEFSKEPTPIPKVSAPSAKSSLSTSPSQVATSKPKASFKRRRGSDIYTSSEDEGEIRPSVKRETASNAIPMTTSNHRNDVSTQSHTSRLPPADDHAALRAHYDTYYLPYLGNFQLLMKHKTKICNLLKKMDKGSSGSVTESDGDGELLDPDELRKLALEYHNQHGDLDNIQRIFSKRDQ